MAINSINSIKTTDANSAPLATSDQGSSESYWALIALNTPPNGQIVFWKSFILN